MLKDSKWATRELRKYLRLLEQVPTGELTPKGNPRMKRRGTDSQINQQRYVVIRIYEELFTEIPRFLRPEHVHEALAEVQRGEELDQNLGDDDSPTFEADSLHPWVWSAAAPHWASDAHREAVSAAAINVNSRLQKKLRRSNLSESKLIREAFSLESPEPGRPRLRLCDDSNPDLFKDMHRGAMELGTGLYAAVRNPLSHMTPDDHDLPPQEALESLAAFSLLARWIHQATVERHDED